MKAFKSRVQRVALHIEQWLYPAVCLGCKEIVAEKYSLCVPCFQDIKHITNSCVQCGIPMEEEIVGLQENEKRYCAHCVNHRFAFEELKAVSLYQGVIKNLIMQYKYQDKTCITNLFSNIIYPKAQQLYGQTSKENKTSWVIVPIPMHWRTLLQRRYNHAALLANALGKKMDIPVHYDLKRVKHTKRQATLGAKAREKNVKRAFKANISLRGKTVLLIDDVVTTGATLEESSKALKEAGVKAIYALTVARVQGTLKIGTKTIKNKGYELP